MTSSASCDSLGSVKLGPARASSPANSAGRSSDRARTCSSICAFVACAATPLNLKALTHLRSAAVLPTMMSEDVKLSLQCTPSTTTRSDAVAIPQTMARCDGDRVARCAGVRLARRGAPSAAQRRLMVWPILHYTAPGLWFLRQKRDDTWLLPWGLMGGCPHHFGIISRDVLCRGKKFKLCAGLPPDQRAFQPKGYTLWDPESRWRRIWSAVGMAVGVARETERVNARMDVATSHPLAVATPPRRCLRCRLTLRIV